MRITSRVKYDGTHPSLNIHVALRYLKLINNKSFVFEGPLRCVFFSFVICVLRLHGPTMLKYIPFLASLLRNPIARKLMIAFKENENYLINSKAKRMLKDIPMNNTSSSTVHSSIRRQNLMRYQSLHYTKNCWAWTRFWTHNVRHIHRPSHGVFSFVVENWPCKKGKIM